MAKVKRAAKGTKPSAKGKTSAAATPLAGMRFLLVGTNIHDEIEDDKLVRQLKKRGAIVSRHRSPRQQPRDTPGARERSWSAHGVTAWGVEELSKI